ncbi:MAG TPA: hypothetical protein VIN07_05575 [Flavipsychrobacter sp.]
MNNKIRVSFKVPDNIDIEQLEELAKKRFGDDFRITDEHKVAIEQMKKEKAAILPIINPYFDDLNKNQSKENNKKRDELIALGRFIYNYKDDKKIKIIDCSERPDFILQVGNDTCGVEVTRLVDPVTIPQVSILKKQLQKIEEKIQIEYPHIKGHVNLQIDPDLISIDGKGLLSINKEKSTSLIDELTHFLTGIIQKTNATKPRYISDFDFIDSDKLEVTLSEQYILEEVNYEYLKEEIKKKEGKIEDYKKDKKIELLWLLICINGVESSASFHFDIEKLKDEINNTQFDMIFIFDEFKGAYFWGKPNH